MQEDQLTRRRLLDSQRAHQGKMPMGLNDIANAKAMGEVDLHFETRWKKILKVVLLLEEIIQHLRQGSFFSPSVFPISPSAASWKVVWLPQSHCFPKLHYSQPQTDLGFLLTSLASSSFTSFSPAAKLLGIYSRDAILQLQLF